MSVPVVDLFSGPGGLGEGFSSLDDGHAFRTIVSAEMDPAAQATLQLRSFFRRIRLDDHDANAYYDFCNGENRDPWNSRTASAWKDAAEEARLITLGTSEGNALLDSILSVRLKKSMDCVLIGGPPCQAYSLVGRSRNLGKSGYRPEDDHRHFLYREYLRAVHRYRPAVFVMENVKGILSSKVGGRSIFNSILTDLVDPDMALTGHRGKRSTSYRIHSLVASTTYTRDMDPLEIDLRDFVVHAEEHGIPQARHRVILVGVREDIGQSPRAIAKAGNISVADAIGELPRLRSRLSKGVDSPEQWSDVVRDHLQDLAREAKKQGDKKLASALAASARSISRNLDSGSIRLLADPFPVTGGSSLTRSLHDPRLRVILNHEARGHMSSDLRRYAYAATFARLYGMSPKGHAGFWLEGLKPSHANWESGKFSDRFRVQLWNAPSTTVTSHISKDGHYFIHPDAAQCRSLTVREAARLQTFPDNYFFQGNRTQQFHQVGNAVPPYLASQIAAVVRALLNS
jgi:DNA (cytosine-5)-methyltransferase 1